jgi:integral membrane protein
MQGPILKSVRQKVSEESGTNANCRFRFVAERSDPHRKTKTSMKNRRPITLLRIVGLAEGTSFLALLLVAMPLKYFADLPIFVRIVGSVHGGLFLLYLAAATYAFWTHRWSYGKFAKVLLASLFPAGTFLIDRQLREEARATETPSTAPAPDAEPSSASAEMS